QVRGREDPLDSAPVVVTAARQRGALVQPAVARGPAALAGQHSDRSRGLARDLQLLADADPAARHPVEAPQLVDGGAVTTGDAGQAVTADDPVDLAAGALLGLRAGGEIELTTAHQRLVGLQTVVLPQLLHGAAVVLGQLPQGV